MPVIRHAEGTEHQVHNATFTAYANSGAGSTELAAWNTRVPAGSSGTEHRISREEIFLIRSGRLRATLDGASTDVEPGDVVVAPAGTLLRLDNPGAQDADIWAVTGLGLTAKLADGTEMAPPWAQ